MTLPSSPKKVVVLALPGARELDLASVLDVFTLANSQLAPNPAYQIEVVTSDAKGRVTGMTGLKLVGNVPYFACTGEIDTLLIAGGVSLVRSDPEEPSLVAWLRNRAFECRRVGSICTGGFVLARAGLLDGRRATTHWEYAKELAIRFPKIKVDSDPIWTCDGNIYTSAGATSGIDLCLALVEEDHGNKLALDVARAMVMFLYRPGNQAQFSVLLSAESAVSPSIRKLQAWLPEHLTEDLSVPALARRACMTPRTFQRVFTEEVGKGPSIHVEELRIEAVRRKLELTSLRLSEIAEQCGFASSDVMTRRFRFHLKVKPLDYRTRFRSSIGPGKSLRKGHPPTKGSPKIPGRRQQGDMSYRSNDRVSPE
jgi:transcriptional regulator GlxA family with amidase domain